MAFIYSKRLYTRSGGATGTITAATVPAGKVWIVRDIDIYDHTALGVTVTLGAPTGGVGPIFKIAAGQQDILVSWRGRWVLAAGEQLRYNQGGASTNTVIMINGYQLDA